MSIILPRRGFLAGLASLLAAPAIVRIENIMPVRSIVRLIDGVPQLVFYASDGSILQTVDAPSEPLNPELLNHIYSAPSVMFDIPHTCAVSHVELLHQKLGRLNVQLGNGAPKYVTAGQKAVLDKFDVRLT